ncbi:MAG: redoxin domain-containing protein [Candidatus Acidiferrum sp.]
MKKTLIIIAAVLLAVGITIYADRATRLSTKHMGHGPLSAEKSIGSPAPELALKDLNGKDVSLSQFKGQVVLVNFWATWCGPCREEIPGLIALQQKYGAKGFTVLGIAMDEEGKKAVAPYVANERFDVHGQKLPMSYPIVLGNDEAADKFGGLFGLPTSILISRSGKQVKHISGAANEEEFSEMIESQL